MKYFKILSLYLCFAVYSCANNNQENKDINIACFINDKPIHYDEIDKIVNQQLFDELNRIYLIRKDALMEKISERLFLSEANKKGVSVSDLIDSHYRRYYSQALLDTFIQTYDLESGVRRITRGLEMYDIHSKIGKEILDQEIRSYLRKKLVDSLMTVNKIVINLKPPLNPTIGTSGLKIYYRGNLQSKITFLEISDFECEACRRNAELFQQLYQKYKEKLRFGYTNFSSYVSISAIGAECAGRQNAFWEFHDSIYNMEFLPDTQKLFELAQHLNLDQNTFKSDFYNKGISDSLWSNIKLIEKYGVYGTPTILINNKLLFNVGSISEIEGMIIGELNKIE